MNRFATLLLATAAFGLPFQAFAAQNPAQAPMKPELRAQLAAKIPGAKAEDVRPSPVPGLYEVMLGTSVGYVSADGRYVISGDLFEIATKTNLTDVRKADMRRKMLSGLKEDQMIIFAPAANVKHTITVFTDVDCTYCRKLHSEIGELNKLGVRVRYLAYPRTGPNTESWAKMEQVYCSKNRKEAMTQAKQGESVKAPGCANPVAAQFELGEEIGVNGTPAIITDTGEYIGGYLPAAKLAQYLNAAK